MKALEEGTQKLEEGDVEAANALYKRSIDIKRAWSFPVTAYLREANIEVNRHTERAVQLWSYVLSFEYVSAFPFPVEEG